MDRKRLFPILLIVFTNILGADVILPILPLYAKGQFGGSILQITLLSTSFLAAQFLAAPWLGRLSDRYGRRPVLIVSQIGTVATRSWWRWSLRSSCWASRYPRCSPGTG